MKLKKKKKKKEHRRGRKTIDKNCHCRSSLVTYCSYILSTSDMCQAAFVLTKCASLNSPIKISMNSYENMQFQQQSEPRSIYLYFR